MVTCLLSCVNAALGKDTLTVKLMDECVYDTDGGKRGGPYNICIVERALKRKYGRRNQIILQNVGNVVTPPSVKRYADAILLACWPNSNVRKRIHLQLPEGTTALVVCGNLPYNQQCPVVDGVTQPREGWPHAVSIHLRKREMYSALEPYESVVRKRAIVKMFGSIRAVYAIGITPRT